MVVLGSAKCLASSSSDQWFLIRSSRARARSEARGTAGEARRVASAAVAEIEPLRALHYDLDKTGGLQQVLAPPYDVIDAEQRAELEARSPYNVVRIDLPVGDDPYAEAGRLLADWRREGVIATDAEPAFWPLEQDYTGP